MDSPLFLSRTLSRQISFECPLIRCMWIMFVHVYLGICQIENNYAFVLTTMTTFCNNKCNRIRGCCMIGAHSVFDNAFCNYVARTESHSIHTHIYVCLTLIWPQKIFRGRGEGSQNKFHNEIGSFAHIAVLTIK